MNEEVERAFARAEAAAKELVEAISDLRVVLASVGVAIETNLTIEASLRGFLSRARERVFSATRPRGVMVDLEWTGWEKRDGCSVEIIRRTGTQCVSAGGDRYALATGKTIGRGRFGGRWCITEASLALVHAMPIGDTDAAKALKAHRTGAA